MKNTPFKASPYSEAPRIAPLEADSERPFWSVMVPHYNCADYMRETLRSVLSQDPGQNEMEIEVVDNCSTVDDPAAVVADLGNGRIKFHQQAVNLGPIENFNECIRRATGEWIHILHADDLVRPGFYARARELLSQYPHAGAFACRIIYIDEDSLWTGLSEAEARMPRVLGKSFMMRQFLEQRFQFAGMIVHRSVYEELGGFRPELRHCADWDMWNRIAAYKNIAYEPDPLACYRQHSASDTSAMMRTGANVVDERRAIRVSCAYLPDEMAPIVYRKAMIAAAARAVRRIRKYWSNGDRTTAYRQLREALRCSLSLTILARVVGVAGAILLLRPEVLGSTGMDDITDSGTSGFF